MPWPRFAVFLSFTLRANETAAELAFVPRSAMRLLPPGQIDTAATRHARSRAARPPPKMIAVPVRELVHGARREQDSSVDDGKAQLLSARAYAWRSQRAARGQKTPVATGRFRRA